MIFCGRRRGTFFLAGALATASTAVAAAAPAGVTQEYRIDIPAGPLGPALEAYARQTGRQLLYRSETAQRLSTRGLRGRFSADGALRHLLSGTRIEARQSGPNTFILVAGPAPSTRPRRTRPPEAVRREAPPQPRMRGALPEPAEDAAIVVTGSNIRRAAPAGTEVITLDRQEIERGGFGSVAEAVASLPQNFGGTGNEDTSLTSADTSVINNSIASSANLRGMGSDATLTLVNGRRVAGAGGRGDFADLSLIPLSVVERIEVLPDGASAIYGSDAVGGVLNLILRRSMNGAESQLRAATSTQGGGEDIQASQLVGASWRTGHVLAAYEFGRREALRADQRRYTRSADLRRFGGDDWRQFFSNPGNIMGFDPQTGALVPLYAIPPGQNGAHLRPQDLRSGENLENQLEGTDLLPMQERHNLYVSAEQEVTSGIRFFAEGRFAQRHFLFHGPAAPGVFLITTANPFFVSPDGSPFAIVAYSFFNDIGPTSNRGRVRASSATAGLDVNGPGDWLTEAYFSRGTERTRTRTDNFINATFVNEALGTSADDPATAFSTARDGFLNLFGDHAVNSASIVDFIAQGYFAERLRSLSDTASVKADGSLLRLPGGSVRAAIGATLRREKFGREGEALFSGSTPTALNRTNAHRTIRAVFAELLVPLFGPANARPGLRRLEFTAALRHEAYSDFGATTNPKVSLLWEPALSLRFGASFGTSFRAPALREVRDPVGVSPAQLPDGHGGETPVLFLSGGNPDLKAERAHSLSATARWSPAGSGGTALQATYFQTDFKGRIEQPALEESSRVLADPIFAPFVRFVDPTGNAADRATVVELMNRPGSDVPSFFPPEFFQAIVDGRYVNAAEVRVRGIDLLATQPFRLVGGTGNLSLNASYLIDYKRRVTPVAPLIERVATLGAPADLRVRSAATWTKANWGLSLGLNYVNGYADKVSNPARRVDSWTTADFQLRYDGKSHNALGGFSFALTVQNLFDQEPPFANRRSGHGYDATNADPLGRVVSVQLAKRW